MADNVSTAAKSAPVRIFVRVLTISGSRVHASEIGTRYTLCGRKRGADAHPAAPVSCERCRARLGVHALPDAACWEGRSKDVEPCPLPAGHDGPHLEVPRAVA